MNYGFRFLKTVNTYQLNILLGWIPLEIFCFKGGSLVVNCQIEKGFSSSEIRRKCLRKKSNMRKLLLDLTNRKMFQQGSSLSISYF